jgi:hypothetical protein
VGTPLGISKEIKIMRLGISFHETLPLRRANIAQVLTLSQTQKLTPTNITSATSLGTNEVKATPRFMQATGLLDNNTLTPFGNAVLAHDPNLDSPTTLWLLHYHLVAPHHTAPAYWRHLVLNSLRLGVTITSENLAQDIGAFQRSIDSKEFAEGTLRSSASVFLSAYSQESALGGLGILQKIQDNTNSYVMGTLTEVPWRAVAYALADFWEGVWGDRNQIPYSDVMATDGPTALLLLDSGTMGQHLTRMRQENLIEVQRVARPWTAARNWKSKNDLLETLYDDHTNV